MKFLNGDSDNDYPMDLKLVLADWKRSCGEDATKILLEKIVVGIGKT